MSNMGQRRKTNQLVDTVIVNVERRLAELYPDDTRQSDRQLCLKAGIHPDAMRSMRRGHSPNAETLISLARCLDVTVEYLATGKPADLRDPFEESRVIAAVEAVFVVQETAGFSATPKEFSLILLHFLRQATIPDERDAAKFALEALKGRISR